MKEKNVTKKETFVDENKHINKKQEKTEEIKIKESIRKILKEKIAKSGFWTNEQLAKVSNIEESQVEMIADYIYDMGKNVYLKKM